MNKNDIILSVENLDTFLKVSELKGATVKLKSNGQPFFYTGGFSMVFQLEKDNKKWAFRVWHTGFTQQKDRFWKISQYLEKQKLPYFVDFIYDENGLLVNGELVDTIRMEWLEGDLLKDYIEKNLNDKNNLQKLADNFLKMCDELHSHKISHGDLQHGNIFIDNQKNIRLIDYDSVCVPEIEGQEELVTGLKGYQHPSRVAGNTTASIKADYFSELVIYLSLFVIAEKPELWNTFSVKDTEVLLFNEDDLKNLKQSAIYSELKNINSDLIDNLLDILEKYLNELSYLDLQAFIQPPEIVKFETDKEVIIEGQPIILSWKVNYAKKVEINNGIGEVKAEDSRKEIPIKIGSYKIKAANHFGKVSEKEVIIRIFPTPIIESLKVPMPDFESRINLSPIKISSPKIDVSINIPELNLNLPNFNLDAPKFSAPDTDLSKIKPQYKSKMSIFNFSKIHEYIRQRSESRGKS
jgi:serine/threonine protein kinase